MTDNQPPTPDTPPTAADLAARQQDDDQGNDNVSRETLDNDQGNDDGDQGNDDKRQTFGREYVEQLRTKGAGYRLRAKEAENQLETLQRQLFKEKLQRLDLVVDTDAVPYDPDLLDDDSDLSAAVETLLESKPYLRKRNVGGNIGQHTSNDSTTAVSLLSTLRNNA